MKSIPSSTHLEQTSQSISHDYLVPLSTVHGTTTEQANNSVIAYVENNMDRLNNGHVAETDEDRKVFMEERESMAANLIRDFLDNAPDQTIALIFGAKHSFANSFDGDGRIPQLFYKPPTLSFPQALKEKIAISVKNSSRDDSCVANFGHEEDEGILSQEDRLSLDKFLDEYPNSIGNLMARGTRADIEHVLTMVHDHEKALEMLSKFKD